MQYVQVGQRANLVDIAETALLRMTREIRLALPNSVRVSGTAIEFLRTVDGGRYRSLADAGGAAAPCGSITENRMSFTNATDCFEVLGNLVNLPAVLPVGGSRVDCVGQDALCLVIFNTGQTGANAYALNNIAAVSAISATSVTFDNSGDVPGFNFPYQSPRQRFQIVDTPVSFVCDVGASTIRRLSNYDILAAQPTNVPGDFINVSNNDLLANRISACAFTYNAGTASRAGLVTLSITVRDNNLGEEVTLLQQAHVDNQP